MCIHGCRQTIDYYAMPAINLAGCLLIIFLMLSPSASGLQELLNICASYAIKHGIIYNVKKTQCMVVPSTKFKLKNTSVFKRC